MKIQDASHVNKNSNDGLKNAAVQLREILDDKGFAVGFAESCTGGLLSSELAKLPGVSRVFKGSIVCYANEVKTSVLGVRQETLNQFGAVSRETALEMLNGALRVLNVNYAVAITGIAGPDGGSAAKPVGTVFIAVGGPNSAEVFHERFFELTSRELIQRAAAEKAAMYLKKFLEERVSK